MRIVFTAHGHWCTSLGWIWAGRGTLELQTYYYHCSKKLAHYSIPQWRGIVPSGTCPSYSYELALKKRRNLLKRPLTSPTRTVNEHDINTFKDNPSQLLGKSFILQDEEGGSFTRLSRWDCRKRQCGTRSSSRIMPITYWWIMILILNPTHKPSLCFKSSFSVKNFIRSILVFSFNFIIGCITDTTSVCAYSAKLYKQPDHHHITQH